MLVIDGTMQSWEELRRNQSKIKEELLNPDETKSFWTEVMNLSKESEYHGLAEVSRFAEGVMALPCACEAWDKLLDLVGILKNWEKPISGRSLALLNSVLISKSFNTVRTLNAVV